MATAGRDTDLTRAAWTAARSAALRVCHMRRGGEQGSGDKDY
jgi:hypothetical protein